MIITLSGLISSGKSSVANILTTQYGFRQIAFADSVKDVLSAAFGWDRTMLEGTTPESRAFRNQVDHWWSKRLNIPDLTPRWAMQHIGTELFRSHFNDEIWIASLENKIKNSPNPNIVITDARFTNELLAMSKIGAKSIVIKRGEDPVWWNIAITAQYSETALDTMLKTNVHRSEWDWAGYNFDCTIKNNKTLADLETSVKEAMLKIGS